MKKLVNKDWVEFTTPRVHGIIKRQFKKSLIKELQKK